jgi:hypothetical protein
MHGGGTFATGAQPLGCGVPLYGLSQSRAGVRGSWLFLALELFRIPGDVVIEHLFSLKVALRRCPV